MANQTHRRTRDVSTVISIVPIAIREPKPGLTPGEFKIPAVKNGDMFLLTVERCSHPVYLDEARPVLVVPDPSADVANSIVNDYKTSMFGFVPGVAEPGLEWVEGEIPNTPEGKALFSAQYSSLLKDMVTKQHAWFEGLVAHAEDDWARFRQHHFITKLQRDAAMALGLTGKEWMLQEQVEAAMSRCKFCFQMVDPRAIICAHCRGVLDEKRYALEYKTPDEFKPQTRTLTVPASPSGSGGNRPIGA